MSLRICTSCGAPLGGNKCEYCCEYCGHPQNKAGFTAFFEQDRAVGTLTIGGDEYKVYLAEMEAQEVLGAPDGDWDGTWKKPRLGIRRRFVLEEM